MQQDKDNLEEFVQKNREAFDTKEPDPKVWSHIESRLEPKESVSRLWYWKAAVFLLIGAVGFLLVDKYSPRTESSIDGQQVLQVSNLEEFEELEVFYTSIISRKSDKLTEELSESSIFNYLEADLEELDLVYGDLKAVFLESQQSDEIMDRLIHILRQKIHLLNSQIDILEKDKFPKDIREGLDLSI